MNIQKFHWTRRWERKKKKKMFKRLPEPAVKLSLKFEYSNELYNYNIAALSIGVSQFYEWVYRTIYCLKINLRTYREKMALEK